MGILAKGSEMNYTVTTQRFTQRKAMSEKRVSGKRTLVNEIYVAGCHMGLLVETVIYNKNWLHCDNGLYSKYEQTSALSSTERIIPCTSFENFPLVHKVSSVA